MTTVRNGLKINSPEKAAVKSKTRFIQLLINFMD
jgi:hypothetical protein